ncbi:MAG: hypothetical protein II915_04730, partial [Eubacterium sp.]|nr:hypothetical protein [Eubacterium sp.]
MRLSGLVTGMDTEAIVGQLMDAQKAKKKKVTGAKTKLEWKQNIWKDLNTKLKSFYNGSVSKMRLSSSYNVKKAKVSDESKATIDAQPNAVTGSYTMTVDRIASAQFLTSGKTKITSTSQKLSELTDDAGNSLVGKEITVKGPSGTQKLEINADTKVSDLVNTFKNSGLNASFDTTQKKFFISSKTTGEENAFSVTTTTVSQAETDARSALKTAIGFDNMSSANKTIVNNALKTLQTAAADSDEYAEASSSIAKAVYDTRYSDANSAASNLVKAQIYDEYMSSGQAQDAAAADKSLRAQFYQVEEDGSFKLDDGGNRIPKEGTTADLPADYD